MKFSIVIPLYNKAPYVEETLDAVFHQAKLPHEVIIVDDVSTDGSMEIVERYFDKYPQKCQNVRIEIVRLKQNGGVGNARNVGFTKCTGDVVSFLDADDLYAPDLLAQANVLMESNQIEFLLLGIKFFPSNERSPNMRKLGPHFSKIIPDGYRMGHPLKTVTSIHFLMGVGSNVMVKKQWLNDFKFYDKPNFYEGIDYWYRVIKNVIAHKPNGIGLLLGDRLKVREVPGSASRKKFNDWKKVYYPPLLLSFEGSTDTYDQLIMGVVAKRWLRYSIRNLSPLSQKLIFMSKYSNLMLNQVKYHVIRLYAK